MMPPSLNLTPPVSDGEIFAIMVPVPGYFAAAYYKPSNRVASASGCASTLLFNGRNDRAIVEYRWILNRHAHNHSVRENPDRTIERKTMR